MIMKKVLFLPLLQIPSGHHQAADALKEGLLALDSRLQCEKVELLSSRLGKGESLISQFYLQWIHYFPKTYSVLYYQSVLREKKKRTAFPQYEMLFLRHVKNIVDHIKPNIIICTHALPSYLLNRLKMGGDITVPVVNVYTDYFIHDLWGIIAIDYHLVGHPYMKTQLQEKGVPASRIFVTGIPIHPFITKRAVKKFVTQPRYRGLISGGSLGIGTFQHLMKKISINDPIDYYVLCGKNERAYEQLKKLHHPRITPIPYISSREEMDRLYNEADFILTKPGGITISECLFKRVPIFIYHTLPGQEELNLHMLKQLQIIFDFRQWNHIENLSLALIDILHSPMLTNYFNKVEEYHNHLFPLEPARLIYRWLQ
jgi:processive 1,2-diacylglycerol beta-glucosyltransferase